MSRSTAIVLALAFALVLIMSNSIAAGAAGVWTGEIRVGGGTR